ncbi:MAG: hypothetical protein ABI874_13475 [Chloroflexota bacterium]
MTHPTTATTEQPTDPTTLYCYKHPDRETLIRCGRCDRPICLQCQVRHPVGVRCTECARIRKDPLTTLTSTQYALAFASALGAGIVGGFIAPFLGVLFAFFVGPAIGAGIAEFVGRVIGYKRGLPLQVIVGGCIVLGVVIARLISVAVLGGGALSAVLSVNGIITLAVGALISSVVYIIFAIGGAVARLR